MVYSLLFCSGKIIFHEYSEAMIYGATGVISFVLFKWFATKGKLFK